MTLRPHQASKPDELLPRAPNEAKPSGRHIRPHSGLRLAMRRDGARLTTLAVCRPLRLTRSYSATEVAAPLEEAPATAKASHGGRIRRPFVVTDNRCSFIARQFASYMPDD